MITSYVTEFRLFHRNVLPAESRVQCGSGIHKSVRFTDLPLSEPRDFNTVIGGIAPAPYGALFTILCTAAEFSLMVLISEGTYSQDKKDQGKENGSYRGRINRKRPPRYRSSRL